MEYTTDTGTAVQDFLTQRHADAIQQAANFELECRKIEFCQDVNTLGDTADPALDAAAVETVERANEQAAKAADAAKRLDAPPNEKAIRATRLEWLAQYVAQIEAEHAQHGLLIELADSPEQVEASTIAQIVIEGAHVAALAEVAALTR